MHHGNIPPDNRLHLHHQMETHDADQDREMRRRNAQGMLWQFAALCVLCVVGIALLVLVSLVL